MKKQFILLLLVVACGMLICGCDKDKTPTTTTTPTTSDLTQIDPSLDPNYTDGLKYKYSGSWNHNGDYTYAGLYNPNGSVHEMPIENATTGKKVNVMYYGATANDPNFDNTTAVKLAVAAAKAGDEIYFPEGKYYFRTQSLANPVYAHINLKEGVNLSGDGVDKTILVSKFSSEYNLNYNTATISIISSSNITISNVTLTAEVPDEAMPNSLSTNENNPEGNQYAPTYGIMAINNDVESKVSNVVVKNVNIEYFRVAGIDFRSTIDCTIKNCKVSKATDLGGGGAGYGILICGAGNERFTTIATNLDSRYNVIIDNEVVGPFLRHGIILSYLTHNNLIANCTVTASQDESFDLHGEDEFLNVFTKNVAKDINSNGIGLGNSGSTHDATGPANVIYGNTIESSNGGISIVYGTLDTYAAKNTIKNLKDGATGIKIAFGPNTVLSENTITSIGGSSIGISVGYSYVWNDPESGLSKVTITNNTITDCNVALKLDAYKDSSTISDNIITNCTTEKIDNNSSFVLPPVSDYFNEQKGTQYYPTQEAMINRGSWNDVVKNSGYFWFKGSDIEKAFNRMIFYEWDLDAAELSSASKVYIRLTFTSKSARQHIYFWGIENLAWDSETLTWGNAPYVNNCTTNSELKVDETGAYSVDTYPYAAKIYDPNNELTAITDLEAVTVTEEFLTYYVEITDYIKALSGTNFTMILSNETMDAAYSSVRNMVANANTIWPAIIIQK